MTDDQLVTRDETTLMPFRNHPALWPFRFLEWVVRLVLTKCGFLNTSKERVK